ncbi:MAG: Coenzyme F420 hydrogenase/dehydrogenase, beta subunit C-terminal domain, partial [Anaerolineales bacterium]
CEQFCEEVCPRLERWPALEAKVTRAARSLGPIKAGTPNDVIRSILVAGRSAGLLDGVVMLDLDPWELKPIARVANNVEEIVDSLGPQYLWAPVLDALNEAIFQRRMRNLAVVSTPCSGQAIRKLKKSLNPRLKPYQDAIRLSVAVFCTGIYQPELVDNVLVKRMGIQREHVKRLEVSADREWLSVTLWDNSTRIIPRQQAEQYMRSGCASCNDYLGESADIAVGSLGATENSSTLIIRTRIGDVFVRNAIQMNLLETTQEVDMEVLAAAASEKDRRKRAQAFNDLQLLMLDALTDPAMRGKAIQQFVHLYRTPVSSAPQEAVRNSCTGC